MAKKRRSLTDDGEMECPMCRKLKFIGEFYTRSVEPGFTSIDDIWFEKDGTFYGRPQSYCRKCAAARARGHTYMTQYLQELEDQRRRDRAHSQAIQEQTFRTLEAMLAEDRKPKQLSLFDD